MMGDNRGAERGQPRLGPGPEGLDDRQGVHDLLAAQPHRRPLDADSTSAVDAAYHRRSVVEPATVESSSPSPDGPAVRPRAQRKARRKTAHSGRRLFAFDRELGVRFVAGADEAGRGSLAGPLVAAAVLFDLERLTLSDRRALSRLNDSKQHTAEAREELYPLVLRAAAPLGGRLALRARDRQPRAARDEPGRPAHPRCSAWPATSASAWSTGSACRSSASSSGP